MLISPAAASRLSARVCATLLPSRISSLSPASSIRAPSRCAAVRTAVGVGAPWPEDDASFPFRDDVSLSGGSLLTVDEAFSSTLSG